jgi:two-component system, NtrC family, nitrogen regulation sensor histidine kinase NtrY
MHRLRDRLILLFLAATVLPLAATLWLSSSLLEQSLTYASTRELDEVSRALETTGRELYRQSRESLKRDAAAGLTPPATYDPRQLPSWPGPVREFFESGETERFHLSGTEGDHVDYMVRRAPGVVVWSRPLGGVAMDRLSRQYRAARAMVEANSGRDLRRGFLITFLVLALSTWLVSFALLVFFAARLSRPIHELTGGPSELADGNLGVRLSTQRRDEVGRAIQAFNETAGQLAAQRDRLVYLTQLASWQALARKTAHELKNSLTPIRLTVEEMLARAGEGDAVFTRQAAEIVIDEVESLERRVRAFSEFAADPPAHPQPLDVNAVLLERVPFLKSGHAEVTYETDLSASLPEADADPDLLRGILTNLLENAAEAAGAGGTVRCRTALEGDMVAVEVHDSGPGLSKLARQSLFEPSISFKKRGMGLGLSIARKNALAAGGDIFLVKGELGGAGFRVLLPRHAAKPDSDR